jgi:NAD(P)-dependent dehydrogenase (short-subunit alcohol dehydrogenase family)
MDRASAFVFAREGALVVGCDLSVGAAQATVELVRGAGGEMVSGQTAPSHRTGRLPGAGRPGARQFGRVNALFNPAATAYLSRLEDISDEERDRAPATRSTSSGGMKVW